MNQIKNIVSDITNVLFNFNNSFPSVLSSSLESMLFICQDTLNRNNQPSNDDGKSKIREIKNKVESKIQELESKITTAKGSEKRDLEARVRNLKECIKELEELLNSNTKFNILVNTNTPRYSYDGNIATIEYDGTEGSLLHELKHAFQFETGKIDFIQVVNNGSQQMIPGLLYDVGDELESYMRQYAYDGILKFRVILKVPENTTITNTMDIQNLLREIKTNIREIKKMKKITANVIVKIADNIGDKGIYSSISKIPLYKNSSIKEVRKGNEKYRNDFIKGLGLDKEEAQKAYIEFVKVFIQTQPYIYVK